MLAELVLPCLLVKLLLELLEEEVVIKVVVQEVVLVVEEAVVMVVEKGGTTVDVVEAAAARSRVSVNTMRFRSTAMSVCLKAMGSPNTMASAWATTNIPQSEPLRCCWVPGNGTWRTSRGLQLGRRNLKTSNTSSPSRLSILPLIADGSTIESRTLQKGFV